MYAHVVQREVNGALQVVIYRPLSLICVGNRFVEKRSIPAFCNILVDSREKPERVVRPVSRMSGLLHVGSVVRRVLMPRVMRIFHKRKPRAVIYLGGQHEPYLPLCHIRVEMDHALYVLYRIAVSVPVPQAAVDKGSRPRPQECHKAVVGIPCIDHRIEFPARGLHPETGKLFLPEGAQLFHIGFTYPARISIFPQQAFRFPIRLLAEEERKLPGFPRFQAYPCG